MLLEIIILILSTPAGFLIAWVARDELAIGKKWFKIIIFVFFIVGISSLVLREFVISLISFFILIISAISFWKSFDKKWTRKKI